MRENNGAKLQNKIVNAINPQPNQPFGRKSCLICQPGGTLTSDYWKSNITYEITCKPCLQTGKLAQYCGKSGRSGYSWGVEHGQNLESLKRDQPLADHALTVHPGSKMNIGYVKMRVTGMYDRALPRLISEGHQIDKLLSKKESNPSKVTILNSKSNFHQAKNIKILAAKQIY